MGVLRNVRGDWIIKVTNHKSHLLIVVNDSRMNVLKIEKCCTCKFSNSVLLHILPEGLKSWQNLFKSI